MADVPEFESSITGSAVAATGALTLTDHSGLTKFVVRAAADTPAATALDVPFGAARRNGDVLVVGQRPTEWQLLGPHAAVVGVAEGLDPSGAVSVIDLTHGRATMRLTGADAARLLEKICSVDWSDAMTPDGAAVSASVAKVTCDIARDDHDGRRSYLISCDRSFGQYLFDAVLDAGAEFGLGRAGSVGDSADSRDHSR